MKFARRMNNLFASEIRELLKLTENPEVISFAGGLPASELFPIKELQESSQRVFSKQGEKALQYSATEGITPLREWLADKESKKMKRPLTKENILITHGSQQALDLLGKLFIDEEDLILCESPTYLSAINVFRTFEGRLVEVPTDNEGIIPSDLERILSSEENIKLMYVIPTFQNPTGKTWSLERRSQVLQLAQSYEITIIEDNPYGELRYDGEEVQTIFSLNTDDEVILTGSFSKVLCPGYRLGWVVADQKIIEKLSLIKQSTDLQSNTIAQMEIYDYLTHNDIQAHINTITDVYKLRRNLAIQMIQ